MAFNLFPYSNFHKLNLDWVIKTVKEAADTASSMETELQGINQELINLSNEVAHRDDEYSERFDVQDTNIQLAQEEAEIATNLANSALAAIGEHTEDDNLIGNFIVATYWNSQASPATRQDVSSYTSFNPITVTPGRNYTAHIRGGASSKQYPLLFVDGNYNIISHSSRPSTTAWYDYQGVVPEDAVYALITANTTNNATLLNTTYIETATVPNNVNDLRDEIVLMQAGMLDLRGKTVAILGDSISTNGTWTPDNPTGNVPEIVVEEADVGVELSAYVTAYDVGTIIGGHTITSAEVGTEITFTPVTADVGKMVGVPLSYNSASTVTWWEVMQAALGFEPIAACWSGSSITSHQGDANDYKTSYAWHPAQIRKCGTRRPGSMTRVAPDVIIIYRGVNDFSHAPYAQLTPGLFSSPTWQVPATDALDGGGFGLMEGLSITISELREAYPSARILVCTLPVFKRINYDHFPTNNGSSTLPIYNDAIRAVADFYGCEVLDLANCGITFDNMTVDGYIVEAGLTHPTDRGHKIIGNKALRDYLAKVNSDR